MSVATVDLLIVCTQRKWLSDMFADAASVPVHHDYGLDAPLIPDTLSPAWWSPGEHAARLRRAGINFAPDTPSDDWLDLFSEDVLGRHIDSLALSDLDGDSDRTVFAKIAGSKNEKVPADVYTLSDFVRISREAGIPPSTTVQITDDIVDMVDEYRVYVDDGVPVAVSRYLTDGVTYGSMSFPSGGDMDGACEFLREVLLTSSEASEGVSVVDVARLESGRWVVVEANPVWSSNPYDADPAVVVDLIAKAFAQPCRPWLPDAHLVDYAQRRPVLRSSQPIWLTADA